MSMKDGRIVISKKTTRKNRQIKKVQKESLKIYGRLEKGVIRNRMGKVVDCSGDSKIIPGIFRVDSKPDKELVILRCKDENMTGFSGNGFPVYKKLETFMSSTVKPEDRILVINAAECEPGLIHDQWLVENYWNEIIQAAKNFSETMEVKNVLVAAKGFGEGIPKTIPNVKLCKVPPLYPMGEERILLKQILGVELEKSDIPANKGYLVMNVQTLLQIMTMLSGEKLNGRFVTLCDLDNGKAVSAYVEYNTSIREKLKQQFGNREYYLSGSGAMNASRGEKAKFGPDICFAAVASAIPDMDTANKCKGCGKCKKACPMGIDIKRIIWKYEKNGKQDFSALGINKCIGCRSCSYVCAANKCPSEIIEELSK